MEWIECSDRAELYLKAAQVLAEAIESEVEQRDRLTVALSGGSTPRGLYELLAADHRESLPWTKLHFLWGDERLVPAESPDSNYRLALDHLLSKVPVPESNVHRIKTELGARAAAADYEGVVRNLCGGASPALDIVLLGMGPDGHTASLFPGSPQLKAEGLVVATQPAPREPKVERITMTLPLLNSAKLVVFMVAGEDKITVARTIKSGGPDAESFPAHRVRPAGRLVWLVQTPADPG